MLGNYKAYLFVIEIEFIFILIAKPNVFRLCLLSYDKISCEVFYKLDPTKFRILRHSFTSIVFDIVLD